MKRRQAMQYLASIAGGAAGAGLFAGCASGGGPIVDNGASTERPDSTVSSSKLASREVRAQHMYVASAMAPGVNIREFGFKHAMMLPAKAFVDGDGMSVRSKMERSFASRLAQIPDPDFRGPIILDMEGPTYIGGLKSSDPQTYEQSARRINAAIGDLLNIVPDALVSVYDSPHVHKGRQDFAVASRAVQRVQRQTFFAPSLYDTSRSRRDSEGAKQTELRTRIVEFACSEALRLGVPHVFPMLHHRYKGAARVRKEEALQVIDKDEFQTTQVNAARSGGAHGIILWHADLNRLKLARNPEKAGTREKGVVAEREFGNVSLSELAETHRTVLQWAGEAFLSDD